MFRTVRFIGTYQNKSHGPGKSQWNSLENTYIGTAKRNLQIEQICACWRYHIDKNNVIHDLQI